MTKNIISTTDSYKFSHFLQYPNDTTHVSSYIEARGISKGFPETKIVYFGLKPYLYNYLSKEVSSYDVEHAELFAKYHGEPFNKDGWKSLIGKKLPLKIKSLPEGSVVPVRTPLLQVENTDPKYPWLTSYIETSLLRAVWYPTTVATLSYACKNMMRKFWEKTVDDENMPGLDFALHDFGGRGVSSGESAELGGMAHLLSFNGSDTVEAIFAAERYYGAYFEDSIAGYSVPAAEHSTITAWGMPKEKAAYDNMIDKFAGEGKIYSVVSDSYDIFNAVENIICGELLSKIKEKGGRFVIRPDSGNPVEVIMKLLNIIEEKTGEVYLNKKGYKVLPNYFRILQGDGVEFNSIEIILYTLKSYGWSAENLVFGMGGALLQKVNRDTLKFAMKANAIKFANDENWYNVYKKPTTDPVKASKPGYIIDPSLEVVYDDAIIMEKLQTFNDVKKLVRG